MLFDPYDQCPFYANYWLNSIFPVGNLKHWFNSVFRLNRPKIGIIEIKFVLKPKLL